MHYYIKDVGSYTMSKLQELLSIQNKERDAFLINKYQPKKIAIF